MEIKISYERNDREYGTDIVVVEETVNGWEDVPRLISSYEESRGETLYKVISVERID